MNVKLNGKLEHVAQTTVLGPNIQATAEQFPRRTLTLAFSYGSKYASLWW